MANLQNISTTACLPIAGERIIVDYQCSRATSEILNYIGRAVDREHETITTTTRRTRESQNTFNYLPSSSILSLSTREEPAPCVPPPRLDSIDDDL